MQRIRQDITIGVGGIEFQTPDVEFDSCPVCGEQIFDLAAMEKINAHRPLTVPAKARRRKSA
jgi:YgiT-type zinc finger domain-containing protein